MTTHSHVTNLVLRSLLMILQHLRLSDRTGYPLGEGGPYRDEIQALEVEILDELEKR